MRPETIAMAAFLICGTVDAQDTVHPREPEPSTASQLLGNVPFPSDADPGVDQRPYVARGRYLTRAGVEAPLPDEAPAPTQSIPSMTLHDADDEDGGSVSIR